jgi:DNA-binding NtrC family response regulator
VLSSFVASDTRSLQLLERLQRVAESSSPLLIRGERGTGRHFAAWLVHCLSRHADQPFLTLDCLGIPREALEGELFGVEREVLNGVPYSKQGRLELAAGGTLVIDDRRARFHRPGQTAARH